MTELVEALRARCEREVIGDGLVPEVTLGPLHTPAGYKRVRDMIAEATSSGAVVVSAGTWREEDRDSDGYFILPTIVSDVAPDASVVVDEQFGPVLPVLPYDDIDQAVEAANATPFGLTASVWTADDELADRISASLVAGTVGINCHGMAAQDPRLPFGGFGASGIGRELRAGGSAARRSGRSRRSRARGGPGAPRRRAPPPLAPPGTARPSGREWRGRHPGVHPDAVVHPARTAP